MRRTHALDPLFTPSSIAVVGASNKENKVGYLVVRNLISSGYGGPIYPVNRKAPEIQGIKAYPSVSDIPGEVDMAVSCVPARFVPTVIEEAGEKGARSCVIITAGFSEVGKDGKDLEREVEDIALRYGMRLLGPNCLGLVNTDHDMNATFASRTPRDGGLAIISQSGAVCVTVLDWAEQNRVGFSKFISVGNKLDIEESDLIDYLKDDDQTRMVMMYIEHIESGREFIAAAREATRSKPVLALKSGRTEAGAKAASSHTGAIAGADSVYEAAFRKAGVMRVRRLTEFFDFAKAFTQLPLPKGGRVAIVSNAGGFAVVSSDAVADEPELQMASFSKAILDQLSRDLPAEANIYNPIDVLGDARLERYRLSIEAMLAEDRVDSIVVIMAPVGTAAVANIAQYIADLGERLTKPLVTCLMGGADMEEGIRILRASRVPNFDSPERAIQTLGGLAKFVRCSNEPEHGVPVMVPGDRKAVQTAIDAVLAQGRLSMSEDEGYDVLRAYDVPVPPTEVATTPEEAVELARAMGYPVVLKVASSEIAHKSDAGGIAVGMDSDRSVRDNFEFIMRNVRQRMPRARVDGVTVQKMVKGREIIVGINRDDTFGPVVTFGLGGIFVEVLKDVTTRIAPLTRSDIRSMITEIKSFPILAGARGQRPADLDALEDLIARVTQIALDFPEVQELEVNPLLLADEGEGAWAVDALITLRGVDR
ncbi:MAG: acetate--CoA ligase family protein [Thermoplasmata archaeon]|nr:MAG: acetate--CoA ligase family protein [Thermoplasmata archaeon]